METSDGERVDPVRGLTGGGADGAHEAPHRPRCTPGKRDGLIPTVELAPAAEPTTPEGPPDKFENEASEVPRASPARRRGRHLPVKP
jgi:hypothetical protein